MRPALQCTVLTCRTWKTLLALPCFKATVLMSLGWFLSILSCSPLQMTSLVGASLNMLHTFVFYMCQCVCMQCWYNPVYLVCSINTSTFKWYYIEYCVYSNRSPAFICFQRVPNQFLFEAGLYYFCMLLGLVSHIKSLVIV